MVDDDVLHSGLVELRSSFLGRCVVYRSRYIHVQYSSQLSRKGKDQLLYTSKWRVVAGHDTSQEVAWGFLGSCYHAAADHEDPNVGTSCCARPRGH